MALPGIRQPMGPIYGRDYRKHDWMKNISSAFDIWGEHKARQELEARQALADARAARAESRAVALNNARLKGLGQKYSINEWEFEQAQKTAEDERNKANYLLTKEGQDTALRAGGLGEYDRVSHPFSLAPEGSITKTLPSDPASLQSFPTSYENLIAPISAKDQSIAESTLASKGSQEVFQNINYIRRGLQINEDRIIAANAAGDAREMARLQREQQQLKIIEQELKNKLSESTYGSKVSKSQSDAFKAADQRSMQALKLERERQADQEVARLKAYEDMASGQNRFPTVETMSTETYPSDKRYGRKDQLFGEEDPADWTPEQVEEIRKQEENQARNWLEKKGYADEYKPLQKAQLGWADVTAGKAVYSPSWPLTDQENYKRINRTIAEEIKLHVEEINAKHDKPVVTENEVSITINAISDAAHTISMQTEQYVGDIIKRIIDDPTYYLDITTEGEDKTKDPRTWFNVKTTDVKPKKARNIVEAYGKKYGIEKIGYPHLTEKVPETRLAPPLGISDQQWRKIVADHREMAKEKGKPEASEEAIKAHWEYLMRQQDLYQQSVATIARGQGSAR